MDPEERGAPRVQDEFVKPGAVTRAITETATALRHATDTYVQMGAAVCAGYACTLLAGVHTTPVPLFAGAPATTVASMPAGSGTSRDTPPNTGYSANEPIRPRVHEIPHIDPDPGWSLPRPARLPHPTYWPAVLAMGIVLLAWGLVTNIVVTLVGLVVFFVALLGWIGDMRHDS